MAKQTILQQIELAAISYAETELEMNKTLIIGDLQGGGAKAVDFLAAQVLGVIGSSGGILAKLSSGTLNTIVRGIAQRTIAGLGGETESIYALVDAELHSIAKSLGGT